MLFSFLAVGKQILTLFILIAVGFLFGKAHLIDDKSSKHISNLVIYAAIPSVLITSFQRELVLSDLRNFGTIALLTVITAFLSIAITVLAFRKSPPFRGKILRFAVVFSNGAFMGYPLLNAILGPIGIFLGSAYVAAFQFFLWTWGVYCMSEDRKTIHLKSVLLSPGIIGIAVAMALYLLQITLPDIIAMPLQYLGNLNTPLPMIIIGYQLSCTNFKSALRGPDTWFCAFLRMIVIPLLTFGLCLILHVSTSVAVALAITSGAPAAAITSMFATKYDCDTVLASSVVSSQTLMSIFSMPLIVTLTQHFLIN